MLSSFEEQAFCRFCHNVWLYSLLAAHPQLKNKDFNIQWDILNLCGVARYVDNRGAISECKLDSKMFHLLSSIQMQSLNIMGDDWKQKVTSQQITYMQEISNRRVDPHDSYFLKNEGIKQAKDFLAPDYEPCGEKGNTIASILMWANPNFIKALKEELIPKKESWSYMI